MHDEWTKKLPSGKIAHYSFDIVPGTGGVISERTNGIVRTTAVKDLMTREQVEAEFAEPAFGTNIREAVAIVKDWVKNP
jgi:hypothetical protein